MKPRATEMNLRTRYRRVRPQKTVITYTNPEKTILSLNARELEIKFNGSWVALMPAAMASALLWQVQPSPPVVVHSPRYPTRTLNEALPTRSEKVSLSVWPVVELFSVAGR